MNNFMVFWIPKQLQGTKCDVKINKVDFVTEGQNNPKPQIEAFNAILSKSRVNDLFFQFYEKLKKLACLYNVHEQV